MEGVNIDSWIYALSLEQLRVQASLRSLNTEGTQSALRARLFRYEQGARGEHPPPSPATEVLSANFPVTENRAGAGEATEDRSRERGPEESARGEQELSPPEGSTPVPTGTLRYRAENERRAGEFPPQPPRRRENERPPSRIIEPRQSFHGELSTSEACREMRRWNISFSGTRRSDAEAFLIRIAEGRRIAPINDTDLLKCLPFFLTGIALQWYRVKSGQWLSWRDFEAAWRARFGDPDFQFALRDEIQRRTQGEQESVADYLTNLGAMFRRLDPPWSTTEQLNYAHRNMLPRLQIAVHRDDFVDLDSLEILASRIERSYLTASHYRPPPPPERSVCPDLAYRPPPRSARPSVALAATELPRIPVRESRGEAPPRPTVPTPWPRGAAPTPRPKAAAPTGRSGDAPGARREREASPRRPVAAPRRAPSGGAGTPGSRRVVSGTCWNCGGDDHFSRGCRRLPSIHCYRCGRAAVTVRTCPACAGNGGRRS